MARMGPHDPCQPADAVAVKTLFQHFLPRYLRIPDVRDWLMDRTPTPPRFLSTLRNSLSYACMYFPPTSVPRGAGSYPVPPPFLDVGDFMLCEHVFEGIAVGTLFNQREEHALALIRDKMLHSPSLSSRPLARRFAVDLSVSNLEIIEFAWMCDHSLIIACRRLDHPLPAMPLHEDLVLSGDILFYGVIPPGDAPGVPILRMTLSEKPAFCQFCGTRGIKSCACPSTFKTRAPSAQSVPVPFAHDRHAENEVPIMPQGPLAADLATWNSYTKRLFKVNTSGAFFVHWYRPSKHSSGMSLFMSPPHPVSYQFVCGSKQDTLCLASAYVKRMRLCERAHSADARLYSYLSRGSDLGMIVDKEDSAPRLGQFLGSEDGSMHPYFQNANSSSAFPDMYLANAGGTVDIVSSDPSFSTEPISGDVSLLARAQPGPPDSLPHSAETSADLTGESYGSSARTGGGPAHMNDNHQDDIAQAQSSGGYGDREQMSSETLREYVDQALEAENVGQRGIVGARSQATSRGQKLTLSTTSRELQQYMTVDASNTPTCADCGSSFPKRGNLARHIQTVHLKLKPFQCEHCKVSFGYKNHLKRHQIVHQRTQEYRCHVCNREFKGQVLLSRHVQQVHQQVCEGRDGHESGDTERGRVFCNICGMSFSQKSNLSRHKLIHEGLRFVCKYCPRAISFGQRYDLHRHILKKHPEAPNSALVSLAPERVQQVE